MTDRSSTEVLAGRYELVRRIATGGMADIFLARDRNLDRHVALKVLFANYADDERFVARFRREATAVGNLNHPNIVRVYDWGHHGDTYFIAMEYVDGTNLADLLSAEGSMSLGRAVDIASSIAGALGYAHGHGVIHRDIKPGNILITRSGEVKVTDFGIARALEGDENLTDTGMVMGTASYFSPEQAHGDSVGPGGDLYSLGVLLFEMVAGKLPFTGTSPVSIAYKQVNEQPPLASSMNPAVPVYLDEIIDCLLAKDPRDRYPTTSDLLVDLDRLRAGQAPLFGGQPEPSAAPPAGLSQPTPAMLHHEVEQSGHQATRAMPMDASPYPVRDRIDETAVYADDYYEPPNRTGMFVFALVAIVVAAIGGIIYLSQLITQSDTADPGEPIIVPQVVGDPQATASNRLTDAGFTVRVEFRETDEAEPGIVFAQNPAAGSELAPESEVTIIVAASAETVEVPNVVDELGSVAGDELSALGFVVVIEREESEDTEIDRVIRQSIPPGQSANTGSTITLTVSSGPPDELTIPSVTGISVDQATLQLGQRGFVNVTVQFEPNDSVPDGTVIRVNPAPGSTVDLSTLVTLVVSSGPTTTSSTATTTTTTQPTTTSTTAAPTTTTTAAPTTTTAAPTTTTTAATSST